MAGRIHDFEFNRFADFYNISSVQAFVHAGDAATRVAMRQYFCTGCGNNFWITTDVVAVFVGV